MRALVVIPSALALSLALAGPASAVKKVRFAEVKVELAQPFEVDPAFGTMRAALADAIARKDVTALAGLVAPTFVWTVNGSLTEQLDLGRDAGHNLRVAFGFREPGKDADGPVENGPYWDTLADLTRDPGVEKPGESNLVCGPLSATADEAALERAQKAIREGDEAIDWFYAVPDTAVSASPGGGGAPVGTVGRIAVPVLDAHPAAPEGQTAPPATHYQILLPSGKTGWIPVQAARPLVSDRLCYSRTADGQWRIASYDQIEQEQASE